MFGHDGKLWEIYKAINPDGKAKRKYVTQVWVFGLVQRHSSLTTAILIPVTNRRAETLWALISQKIKKIK